MLPPDALEARIARMQALIGAGQDTGYYPRSLLTTGLRQDDPEYEGKYTTLRQPGRQARQPLSRDPRTAASGAP